MKYTILLLAFWLAGCGGQSPNSSASIPILGIYRAWSGYGWSSYALDLSKGVAMDKAFAATIRYPEGTICALTIVFHAQTPTFGTAVVSYTPTSIFEGFGGSCSPLVNTQYTWNLTPGSEFLFCNVTFPECFDLH